MKQPLFAVAVLLASVVGPAAADQEPLPGPRVAPDYGLMCTPKNVSPKIS